MVKRTRNFGAQGKTLEALPPWADYPWRHEGRVIYGYSEAAIGLPADQQRDEWQEVAVAASPEIASVITQVVNDRFRGD